MHDLQIANIGEQPDTPLLIRLPLDALEHPLIYLPLTKERILLLGMDAIHAYPSKHAKCSQYSYGIVHIKFVYRMGKYN